MGPHRDLTTGLESLKRKLLKMAQLAENMIDAAIAELAQRDVGLAAKVPDYERECNRFQIDIDESALSILATQQPVARDLRYLLTLDHVTYELERIGDHASSVAKQVIKLAPEPPLADYVKLPEMAERSAVLVHGVLRALVDADAVAAREVAVLDDDIDRLYHATFDEVVDLMRQDPNNVERGTRIIIASHYLERIGDRSTNIAEDIVYLVTGDVEDLNP